MNGCICVLRVRDNIAKIKTTFSLREFSFEVVIMWPGRDVLHDVLYKIKSR